MMGAIKKIFFISSILFLSQNLFCQTEEEQRASDKVKVGETCPQFTLSTTGKTITASELKGKITLINFFATWCGPCKKELPEVEKQIWAKYKGNKNFQLIVVGRGHGDKVIGNFKRKNGYTFPMYSDSTKIVYEKFADKYIPRNFIVDKNGIIVYSGINYTEDEFKLILKKLEELLK
jgi:peroxiredoxin